MEGHSANKQIVFVWQAIIIIISICLSFAVTITVLPHTPLKVMFLGWSIAFFNYIFGFVIHSASASNRERASVFRTFGFNTIRFIFLLIVSFIAVNLTHASAFGFASSLLVAYFIFLCVEVISLSNKFYVS